MYYKQSARNPRNFVVNSVVVEKQGWNGAATGYGEVGEDGPVIKKMISRSGFPFVVLERFLLQTTLCPKAEVWSRTEGLYQSIAVPYAPPILSYLQGPSAVR